MTRIFKIGTLAGLICLCLAMGTTYSQWPPLPSDPVPAPEPALVHPPTFAAAPAILMDQPKATDRPDPTPPVETRIAPRPPASPQPPAYYGNRVVPGVNSAATAWQPGGYEARRGRPYYYTVLGRHEPLYSVHQDSPTPWAIDHSAYQYHFGPGHYRHSEGGHYRFPYYTYRAPWYFPGHPIYNRDTNRPW